MHDVVASVTLGSAAEHYSAGNWKMGLARGEQQQSHEVFIGGEDAQDLNDAVACLCIYSSLLRDR